MFAGLLEGRERLSLLVDSDVLVYASSDEIFGLVVPAKCANVPDDLLIAKNTWADKAAYDEKAKHLASLFNKNFETYADRASDAIKGAGPKL